MNPGLTNGIEANHPRGRHKEPKGNVKTGGARRVPREESLSRPYGEFAGKEWYKAVRAMLREQFYREEAKPGQEQAPGLQRRESMRQGSWKENRRAIGASLANKGGNGNN